MKSIPKAVFFRHIKEFRLKELFNELGWDNANITHQVKVNDAIYNLSAIAQKKEFLAFLCTGDSCGIPDSAARKKIDNAITRLHYEHLIIYMDIQKTRQHWEFMIREQNKPLVSRPIEYYAGQEPELLFQKLEGLFFSFEDEEKLSIVDVRSRVAANFEKNAEVVTKKFYDRFQKEHQKFTQFIDGIQDKVDLDWYASLMLNRLMFIYFIQRKGFLDDNRDYLRSKLKDIQQKRGRNKFYSFYRNFLLVLFHKGLGSPHHDASFIEDFGKVPYLNGGLFDVHEIEKKNTNISISDDAFERLFEFFDDYNWHLDTRITSTGRDINPDVIGYIFEKYINDRAAMGAYYTKEDITEYISKNCIIPWLFDEVKRNYSAPFEKDGSIWSLLRQSGDAFIYPAVKHGIRKEPFQWDDYSDLPEDVRQCLDPDTPDLVEKRRCWNRPAPPEIALPTEIYREVIARRKRYYEVRRKIESSEIAEINDLITYNLDIRQFAQDILRETEDPELIRYFYKAVRKITVLDPTCGSGAFLFAALNVLEPLYYACVTRMREYVEEHGKGKFKFFEDELGVINSPEHPSDEYFIYKSIILNNLYGVDIMKEAVEIAKLRLFLKLVATVDVDYSKPNLGLEPLPDIDFNIRSGNTLVGYATLADLDKAGQMGLFGGEEKQAILEEADVVSRAYARFKDAQLIMHSDPKSYKIAKEDLKSRLSILNDRLNKYLAVMYLGAGPSKTEYDKWLGSHQPFHWVAEFYWIMNEGGFDVIIGNPPYVMYPSEKVEYKIIKNQYSTESSKNLYSLIFERSLKLSERKSLVGLIVQLTVLTSRKMDVLQNILYNRGFVYAIPFPRRPESVFEGVEMPVCILISTENNFKGWATFSLKRICSEERQHALRFDYAACHQIRNNNHRIVKLGSTEEINIYNKIFSHTFTLGSLMTNLSKFQVYYQEACRYWVKATLGIPYFQKNGISTKPPHGRIIYFKNIEAASFSACLMNSSVLFWLYSILSDCEHMNDTLIRTIPISANWKNDKWNLLWKNLSEDLTKNSHRKTISTKQGHKIEYDEINAGDSKQIIDKIDIILAKHYNLSQGEIDFIINYDIKYRIGKENLYPDLED